MMNRTEKFLLIACAIVVALNIWGVLSPSHWNWGMHFFAFYSPLISVIVGVIVLLQSAPSVRATLFTRFERIVKTTSQYPVVVVSVVLCGLLLSLAWFLPPKLHLLGDGALLLRVIGGMGAMEDLPPNFDHQPLVGAVFELIRNTSRAGSSISPQSLFRLFDAVSGVLFIVLLITFLRKMKLSTIDQTLLGCFVFFAGGSQFFLGYVELYVFLYVCMLAYVITGWFAIEQRLHVAVPLVCFVILLGLHFGSLFLAPSLLMLFVGVWKQRKREASIVGVAMVTVMIVGGVFVLARGSFSYQGILQSLSTTAKYNFLPMSGGDAYFPYSVFSSAHLIDWMNASFLIAPFGLLASIVIVATRWKEISFKDPLFLFLSTATACGLFFTFVMNPALGLARDWDFLSSFFMPLLMLDVYLLRSFVRSDQTRLIVLTLIVVSIVQSIGWIGINANEDRHLRRAMLLNDSRLLGYVPRLNYNETLANYFWYKGDSREARRFWEAYTALDSVNPRTLANLSEVYRKLGENEKTFHVLRRAAENGSRNPAVYMNLGVMYAQHGDTATAISYNEEALKRDSLYGKAHGNLGILFMRLQDYPLAAYHLARAIDLGVKEPFLYRDAGSAYFFAQQYQTALSYFDAYLQLVPGDQQTRNVREQLSSYIQKTGHQ